MKCCEHQHIDAIKDCESCGKALCEDCVIEENNSSLCQECAKSETNSSDFSEKDNFSLTKDDGTDKVIVEDINTENFYKDDFKTTIDLKSDNSNLIGETTDKIPAIDKKHQHLTDETIEKIGNLKSSQFKIILHLVWAILFIILGIYFAIKCENYKTTLLFLGLAIAGIIWTINGLKGHRQALSEKINALRDEIISFDFIQDNRGKSILIACLHGIFFILKIVFLLTLSIIITPFQIIRSIIQFFSLQKEKTDLEQPFK